VTVKRIVFWSHLITGVAAGFVILFLSITGVLLTYEQQIISSVENKPVVHTEETVLPVSELVARSREFTSGKASGLVFQKDEDLPVSILTGRRQYAMLNPYTGDELKNAEGVRDFFHTVTDLHRWFALTDDSRGVGKAITGIANLMFLFLLISGIYIWLPKVWRWPILKTKLLFRKGLPNAKARDYNWHHVFSFWTFIPLFIIICTGSVFSYGWANKLIYVAYGEEAPTRRGPPSSGPQKPSNPEAAQVDTSNYLSLDALLSKAKQHDDDWKRIRLQIPSDNDNTTTFKLDYGSGRQPQKTLDITLDRTSGDIVRSGGFSSMSPASQARIYIRFLHTGESLGLIGQTIAGLASLAACFLVYTGLALANWGAAR